MAQTSGAGGMPGGRSYAESFFGDAEKDAFWLTLSPEERERIIEEDEAEVVRAREDIEAFFSYVMREQTTRAPIRVMPHQRVGLSFIMHHDRSVNMWPVGTSKTHCSAALTLFLLGRDPTLRGAIVSATQGQAAKVLAVVADYIEHSPELRRVFPHLRPSPRRADMWTQTTIIVDRPPGIPDASVRAVGIDGGLPGARLNWIVVDDILNRENTATKDQRDKVYEWFDSTVLSRLDPVGAKVIVTNTAWHPDDLVHRLEKLGWPTIRMDVEGNIRLQDDAQWMREGREPWDHEELRPASSSAYEENYRLRSHDPDPRNETPLWPERYSREYIDNVLRVRHLPGEFNRAYMNVCRDDGTSMCKQEFIDLCKRKARAEKCFSLVSEYRGPNPTFTGVDLAVSPGEEHDDTAFFTFEARPDGTRVVLDVEIGQWDGPTIIKKLIAKQAAYNSVVRIENNACFVPGTRVLTRERGYVAIEDVRIGEHVWTHRARWRPVTRTLSGTAKKITRFKVRGSVELRMTPNHWVYMREAGEDGPTGQPTWISAGFADKPAYAAIARPDAHGAPGPRGEEHAWEPVLYGPGTWEEYGGPVHNLEVAEDASYTAEDVIVHNAQDFIRQFALQIDVSLPLKAHTTGRAKAHPEHGVAGIFLELANGAWLIPNARTGECHPMVQKFVDACLYYSPSKHTDDVLMAAYFSWAQAKEWGLLAKTREDSGTTRNIGAEIMAR